MKYIGLTNERSEKPKFHFAKHGKPLCGAELDASYEREGLPPLYFLCPDCTRRNDIADARPANGMTNGERAALNIRLCREHIETLKRVEQANG